MHTEAVPYAVHRDQQIAAQRIAEAEKTPTVISNDARFIAEKIVTHMWIIFVLLPLVLYVLISAMK